ncbi:hypothetical protein JL721_462 [Aureococcus anophagefferens]|nr:hypothetical protein JL721_462 [Aureococcus anophagefferens]
MGRFLRATARVARSCPRRRRASPSSRGPWAAASRPAGSRFAWLAASFLRLLGAAHDGALAACVLHGLDGVLGDAAVELLGAADLDAHRASALRAAPPASRPLVRALPALSREDRGAAAEMLARLVQDFEHAPLPHAFLVDLATLPLAARAPAAGGKKKRRRADA